MSVPLYAWWERPQSVLDRFGGLAPERLRALARTVMPEQFPLTAELLVLRAEALEVGAAAEARRRRSNAPDGVREVRRARAVGEL